MAKSTEIQSLSRSTPPPPSPTRQGAVAGPGTKFEVKNSVFLHFLPYILHFC